MADLMSMMARAAQSNATPSTATSGSGRVPMAIDEMYGSGGKRRKRSSAEAFEASLSNDRQQTELGMVTCRIAIDYNLGMSRKESAQRGDAVNIIGSVMNIAILDIIQTDPIFIDFSNRKIGGFSSFNGFDTKRFASQYELESCIRFIGIAKTAQLAADDKTLVGRKQTGISTIVRGLQSFYNTGTLDLDVGELFVITPPQCDKAKRESEMTGSVKPVPVPEGKYIGVVHKLSQRLKEFSDVAAYQKHLANIEKGGDKSSLTAALQTNNILDPVERYAAVTYLYQPAVSTAILMTLLAESGLIEIKVPEKISPSYAQKLNSTLKATDPINLPSLPANPVDGEKAARDQTSKTSMYNRLQSLFTLMGLTTQPLLQVPELIKLIYQQIGNTKIDWDGSSFQPVPDSQVDWTSMTRLNGNGPVPIKNQQTVGDLMEGHRLQRGPIQRYTDRAYEDATVGHGRLMIALERAHLGSQFTGLL